jgi:cullin-4
LESLYTLTEQTVLSGRNGAENLYERVKLELERGIGDVASALRSGPSTETAEARFAWLQRLVLAWQSWCDKATLNGSVLTLLNQAYLLEQPGLLSVWDLSLDLFLHSIVLDEALQSHAVACITTCVNSERKNRETSYRTIHLSLISMLITLERYPVMEDALHQATKSFYTQESEAHFTKLDISQYLVYAESCLEKEQERGQWLFADAKGRHENIVMVQEIMVKTRASSLVTGLSLLLEQASMEPMTLMYRLLVRVKELAPLRAAFGKYIVTLGQKIVQEESKDDTMIERLLDYKAVIDKTVKDAFMNDGEFRQTQKESFEIFVNKRENKPAELIGEIETRCEYQLMLTILLFYLKPNSSMLVCAAGTRRCLIRSSNMF